MATIKDTLNLIDPNEHKSMVVEASVREYCVLALKFLKGEADYSPFFDKSLPSPFQAMEEELVAKKYKDLRYCIQLYAPTEEALLADAIADLSFSQMERLSVVTPSNPQADDRERATVYVIAVYILFALALHGRKDFAKLFFECWDNYVELASARVVRRHYDPSWRSRYDSLFYPLGRNV